MMTTKKISKAAREEKYVAFRGTMTQHEMTSQLKQWRLKDIGMAKCRKTKNEKPITSNYIFNELLYKLKVRGIQL